MNAIPSGRRADYDDGVAGAFRNCACILVVFNNPNGHTIYKWVALIAVIKIDLTANRRHAETIPVITNAFYNAIEKVTNASVLQ